MHPPKPTIRISNSNAPYKGVILVQNISVLQQISLQTCHGEDWTTFMAGFKLNPRNQWWCMELDPWSQTGGSLSDTNSHTRFDF